MKNNSGKRFRGIFCFNTGFISMFLWHKLACLQQLGCFWCEQMNSHDHSFLSHLVQCSKTFLPPDVTHVSIHDFYQFPHQGVSSSMFTFTLSYTLRGYNHDDNLVLRVYNNGFESIGFKEFTLLKALNARNSPVPNVWIFEPNDIVLKRAFMIMEKIDGVSASYFLNKRDSALPAINKMAEALSIIHKLNPKDFKELKILQKQYEFEQKKLLKTVAWIKKTPSSFFNFFASNQKRFIKAVKRLDDLEPKKFQAAIIHNDF